MSEIRTEYRIEYGEGLEWLPVKASEMGIDEGVRRLRYAHNTEHEDREEWYVEYLVGGVGCFRECYITFRILDSDKNSVYMEEDDWGGGRGIYGAEVGAWFMDFIGKRSICYINS